MKKALNAYVVWGDAIVRRLDALKKPGDVLVTWREKLRAVQDQLRAGNDFADQAWAARHAVITEVADDEAKLEAALESLADALPGEGIGTRANPFAGISEYTVARLHELGHLHLADEATSIADKVRTKVAKKGKARAAIGEIDTYVKAVRAAQAKVGTVEDAFHEAVRSRDAVLIAWHGVVAKLRRRVDVHFEDDAKSAKAIFAPPASGDLHEAPPNAKAAKANAKALKAADKAAAKAGKAAEKQSKAAAKAALKASREAAKSAPPAPAKKRSKRAAR